jgi:hypothetical protein
MYAMHVDIRNRSNQVIKITEIDCKAESEVTNPVWAGVKPDSPAKFIRLYKPRLPDAARLHACRTVSGWRIVSAPSERYGSRTRLTLTVVVTDQYLRTYRATEEMTV